MDEHVRAEIESTLREIIAPLVRTDGGEVYLVRVEGNDVYIHLSGACAGCPGASLTAEGIILPALRASDPNVRVIVTTGLHAPDGSTRM